MFKKIIASVLVLTVCFAGQCQAFADLNKSADALSVSSGFDKQTNPVRAGEFAKDVAEKKEPGAIGNGQLLIELVQKREEGLPLKFSLEGARGNDIYTKIRAAIKKAEEQYVVNKENVSDPVLRDLGHQTFLNLLDFNFYLSKELYPFISGRESIENYLVGFNIDDFACPERAGVAIDFIDWLFAKYADHPETALLRLAQYIFHERVPEKTIIKEGVIDRSEHKLIYEKLQGAIFGDDEVKALKADLREFINIPIAGALQTLGLAGMHEAGSSVLQAMALQIYDSGNGMIPELPYVEGVESVVRGLRQQSAEIKIGVGVKTSAEALAAAAANPDYLVSDVVLEPSVIDEIKAKYPSVFVITRAEDRAGVLAAIESGAHGVKVKPAKMILDNEELIEMAHKKNVLLIAAKGVNKDNLGWFMNRGVAVGRGIDATAAGVQLTNEVVVMCAERAEAFASQSMSPELRRLAEVYRTQHDALVKALQEHAPSAPAGAGKSYTASVASVQTMLQNALKDAVELVAKEGKGAVHEEELFDVLKIGQIFRSVYALEEHKEPSPTAGEERIRALEEHTKGLLRAWLKTDDATLMSNTVGMVAILLHDIGKVRKWPMHEVESDDIIARFGLLDNLEKAGVVTAQVAREISLLVRYHQLMGLAFTGESNYMAWIDFFRDARLSSWCEAKNAVDRSVAMHEILTHIRWMTFFDNEAYMESRGLAVPRAKVVFWGYLCDLMKDVDLHGSDMEKQLVEISRRDVPQRVVRLISWTDRNLDAPRVNYGIEWRKAAGRFEQSKSSTFAYADGHLAGMASINFRLFDTIAAALAWSDEAQVDYARFSKSAEIFRDIPAGRSVNPNVVKLIALLIRASEEWPEHTVIQIKGRGDVNLDKEPPEEFSKYLFTLNNALSDAQDIEKDGTHIHLLDVRGNKMDGETYIEFNQESKELTLVIAPFAAPAAQAGAVVVDWKTEITNALPRRGEVFKQTLKRVLDAGLAENPDQFFFFGVEDGIGLGNGQKPQMQEMYNAIAEIKDMKNAKGEALFPNLVAEHLPAEKLIEKIETLQTAKKLTLDRVFIGARQESVAKEHVFDTISGEGRAWIASIDDSETGSYLPVMEAMTVNMLAYSRADISAVKEFYDAIAKEPVTIEKLQDMINNRIIYILPKTTRFDTTKDLQDLYKLVAEQIRAMA